MDKNPHRYSYKSVARYFDELIRGVSLLSDEPNAIFLGQSVCYHGHVLSKVVEKVPAEKKLELPVFEETQMGISTGLALAGYLPITVYPRFNFLLLATNQLVNHLDKISKMSHGEFEPKVIILTMVGSERPLYPGSQHVGNFSEAFRSMLTNIAVLEFTETEQIYRGCQNALRVPNSTLMIFHGDYCNEK